MDAKRVALEGHSRYGKGTIVAMAYEPRLAVAFISSSGAGGAKIMRRTYGELLENVAAPSEYHWMAGNFLKYAGPLTVNDLPVDAHQLVALCAPRPVFISSGDTLGGVPAGDGWVDAKGMFLAGVHAGPVYRLLGKKDLGTTEFPKVETALIDGEIGFRQHTAGHTPGPNWPTFLTFAERYFTPNAKPAAKTPEDQLAVGARRSVRPSRYPWPCRRSSCTFSRTRAALRAWFVEHAATADELHVGYYKRHTGKPSPTWSESVDEALCFGWIDGVRHSVDADRYTIRFTPRRKGSHWSEINIAKVKALIAAKRMTPAGLAAYEGAHRDEDRPRLLRAAADRVPGRSTPRCSRRSKAAWAWFSTQPPGYRRTAIWYVVSAVRPETQAKRLATLIAVVGRRPPDHRSRPGKVDAKTPQDDAAPTSSPSCRGRTGPRSPAAGCCG